MRSLTHPRPLLAVLVLVLACGKTAAETDTAPTTDPSTSSATVSGTTTGTTAPTTGTSGQTAGTTAQTTGTSGQTTGTSTTGATTTTGTGSTTGPVATTGSTTAVDTEGPACVVKECNNAVYQCGDCIDNDGDGVIDAQDVECVNPCDDDEASFATGIPGDGMDACKQDCFFDGNSGAGNDGCNWNLKCDPLNPGAPKCPYDPNFKCPPQDEMCLMVCKPPTGCDCFGCCSIYVDGMLHDVFLGDPDCSIKTFELCTECTKSEDCNPEECMPEMCKPCINQPLPPECQDPSCPDGFMPCETNADCPNANEYCDPMGCCQPTPG